MSARQSLHLKYRAGGALSRSLTLQFQELFMALAIASAGAQTADGLRRAAELVRDMPLATLAEHERDDIARALIAAEVEVVAHLPEKLAEVVREGMTALTGLVLAAGWPSEFRQREAEQFNEWRALSKLFRNEMENQAIREDLAERLTERAERAQAAAGMRMAG